MKSLLMWPSIQLIIVLIIIIIIEIVESQLMTCPQVCSCIWRNGKQTTICENQNLISIPNQISPSTQVLDLNQNNFQILPSKAFQERGLINLQKLFIPKCKLGAIADDAFYQLTNLVELDLSDNLLTHVPVKALANATNLRRLLLNNNHIATITSESFAALNSLKFLNLSGCKTHTIEARAFYGLRDLEYLYLHDNQLTTLPYAVVADLPALYSFELYRNPWQCNCEMRPTREWMIRNNVGQSIPATCDLPIRLSGLMWNSLDLDDFACEPDIITTTVEVAKVVGSNATLSCTVKGIPEPKVFWYMDHGYYNISSQRSHKYHLSEERTEGTVNSLLTIIGLDMNDDGTSFICSAENRAGIKSKNFTVYVVPSGTFGVPSNWSKVELAGGVLGLLITLVLAFVVITLILIRSKRFSFYGNSTKSDNNGGSGNNDSLEKKNSLNKIFGQNGAAIYPSSINGTLSTTTYTNGTTMQQHALSMLGLDGIDKKPEIFLKPDLLVPGNFMDNTKSNSQIMIMPTTTSQTTATGYELNHFGFNNNNNNNNNIGQQPGHHLTFSNDVLNGGGASHQDTLFVTQDSGYMTNPDHHHQQQQQQMSGLYRAVMVNPTTVITNGGSGCGSTATMTLSSSTTTTTAPQTNSSTMTYNTSATSPMNGNIFNGGNNSSTPPSFMLSSAPNLLYTNQYLSQFDLNNQQQQQQQNHHRLATPPNHQFFTHHPHPHPQQQQFISNTNNRQISSNPSPSPLLISTSYGNPAFISDSAASINGFVCMDDNNGNGTTTTTMMYNDINGDDDEVFRTNIINPSISILEPLPLQFQQLPRQSTTLLTSTSRPNLLTMEESLYGIRHTPINPIQQQQQQPSSSSSSFITMAPMQMAPPAPNHHQQQQQSIYGVTTVGKSRWQTMTPNYPFRQQQQQQPQLSSQMTATTSLSNIRYSPDEGYGEESSTGGSAGVQHSTVGQLQGTEV
ncbi:Leucine rich repeat C-terminal domain [Dermatophagoides farinae]|uniref:Leucine rich repeat C-terminal domain n=1 Tax=Dermatophagoides farinae TaxID=6954 RepID=A0A922L1Z3_DERFA|nr:Leucine rich repeat C-terminal domain [Dermatophagoides farinae]